MKQIITATIGIPSSIFLKHGSDFLQRQIRVVAEDLKEEYGYKSIEYLDHKLEEGYLDTADSDHLSFVVSYEVGIQ